MSENRTVQLVEQLKGGLDAPICLTWELTYACNLECVHCLSSSGRRDPRELTTAEAKAVLDELHDLQVFYINIGGGEPMIRRDFFELLEYSIASGIGVKFSTNGAFIDADEGRTVSPSMDYLDIQISLDGTDAVTNDAVRGEGSYDTAITAMNHLRDAGFGEFKISVVVTRHNVDQLDEFKAFADAVRRTAAHHPAAAVGPRCRQLARSPPDSRRSSVQIYDWLHRARRQRVDRRLVLPPQRARRGTASRTQHVRRRTRRVPDRSRSATSTPARS